LTVFWFDEVDAVGGVAVVAVADAVTPNVCNDPICDCTVLAASAETAGEAIFASLSSCSKAASSFWYFGEAAAVAGGISV